MLGQVRGGLAAQFGGVLVDVLVHLRSRWFGGQTTARRGRELLQMMVVLDAALNSEQYRGIELWGVFL
jgi:hypothetical protein